MLVVLALVYFVIWVIFSFFEFKKRFISPALIFSVTQLIMFLGILKIIDASNKADLVLITLYLFAYVFFIIGCFLSGGILDVKRLKKGFDTVNKNQKTIMGILLFFSIVVSSLFFVRIGANAVFSIVKNILNREVVDISSLRKRINFASGGGIVYQLRNFIIPLITMYLILFGSKKQKVIGYLILPVMIILLLGSGQRAGIFIIMCSIIISLLWCKKIELKNTRYVKSTKKQEKRSKRKVFLFAILFIFLFAILTVFNGRDVISGSTFIAISDRFFVDNQYCSVLAFRYIYSNKIQFGYDWFQMFLDLFRSPNQYITVSSIIHGELYGSLEGTSPPCLWGSAYYNFGFFGVILLSFFIGVLSNRLYSSFIFCKKTHINIILYSSLFFLFGTWNADAPIVLLNSGFLTVAIMIILINFNVQKIKSSNLEVQQ